MGRINEALKEGWLKEICLTKKEKPLYEMLSVSLGLGEASSIAVAKTRGFLFASDDRTARREAGLMEIKLTGTIGILRKSVLDKIIPKNDGNRILGEMIDKGFYSCEQ